MISARPARALEEGSAVVGQRDGSGGPGKQGHAQPLFKWGYGFADRRRWAALPPSRSRKAARLGRGREELDIVQAVLGSRLLDSRHFVMNEVLWVS